MMKEHLSAALCDSTNVDIKGRDDSGRAHLMCNDCQVRWSVGIIGNKESLEIQYNKCGSIDPFASEPSYKNPDKQNPIETKIQLFKRPAKKLIKLPMVNIPRKNVIEAFVDTFEAILRMSGIEIIRQIIGPIQKMIILIELIITYLIILLSINLFTFNNIFNQTQ